MEKGGAKPGALDEWRHTLLTRRTFLLASAGGLAALFTAGGTLAATANSWLVLAAVQNHLFPSELGSPGAREINALSYLQGVLGDPRGDRDEQRFILQGVDWLEDLSRQRHKASFVDLDPIRREQVLREVANSGPGENWLSTLLLYICEALLADPVYGGNPEGIGWAWLGHQAGFPRPTRALQRLVGCGDEGTASNTAMRLASSPHPTSRGTGT
ncbi:MAG: gluconate 2-dehydrogenase subunit 3 family protein [Gallionellaceae bacterium]|nr:gluconate 2-dehydrogenase subunit 3 family protein [Gallionellaceae bacterium]